MNVRAPIFVRLGDVLSVDMPQRVEASVDGVPIFECEYGTSNNQYSLKVGKVLAVSVPQTTIVADPRVMTKAEAAAHVTGWWRPVFARIPFEQAVLLRRV